MFILEYLPWSEYATTAAEVTALQSFRNLFSEEALRPGEQISIRSITVVFTDLSNSTNMYREVGDAKAFGKVMCHFDILREAISEENGAIVKTMGDAVMAVCYRPISAIQKAKQRMGDTPELQHLKLKAGIQTGPCITINQNNVLDYFGSTINIVSRLVTLSSGTDIVASDSVLDNPEVRDYLTQKKRSSLNQSTDMSLKGFGDQHFTLWHIN